MRSATDTTSSDMVVIRRVKQLVKTADDIAAGRLATHTGIADGNDEIAHLARRFDMRTEFGAKITAVENGLQFAVPIHFSFDDANVQTGSQAALDRFADIVTRHYTGAVVTVEGFADPAGSRAYNRKLSTERAESVRSYLMTRNISAQVRAIGYGEDRLVVPDAAKNDAGAELNRRVVFVIESPKAQTTNVSSLLD